MFCWGHNPCGQLGLGDFTWRPSPAMCQGFGTEDVGLTGVGAGEQHSLATDAKGVLWAWGHCADGRLGLGMRERIGAHEDEKYYFPSPTIVTSLDKDFVRQGLSTRDWWLTHVYL